MWFNSRRESHLEGETVIINLKVTYHRLKQKQEQNRNLCRIVKIEYSDFCPLLQSSSSKVTIFNSA